MILTEENYFDIESNMQYMSASQFKAFMKCEAAALAEVTGNYEREKTTALYVGSYVDAHFDETLDIFRAKNPQIFNKNGSLKSDFIKAEDIIDRVHQDKLFMKYMSGEKQVIKTGDIDGVPFKIKMDSYHPGKAIVDLKVMKDFEPIYVPEQGRLNFIEAWGYDIQGAIYQYIEGNNLPFFIAAVTKEKTSDLAVIQIPQAVLDVALEEVKANVHRFADLKKGIGEPIRCEHCDYCKMTKVLDRVIGMEELDND